MGKLLPLLPGNRHTRPHGGSQGRMLRSHSLRQLCGRYFLPAFFLNDMGILPNLFPENAHPFLQSESYIPVCLLSCPCEDVQTLFRCMPHHTGFHPVFVQIDLIYSQDLTSSHPAPFLKFFLRERKGIPESCLR